ncbi:hypothetical protein HH310_20050 [Actinoplanes sp. TBRC 11911]|uniref:hypothetical protein n=1 Tax=Actinoplanes sp. TBRC 11911 TaxID=2729386 RepID=UPI00145DA3BF|nr:hypothetical protein [Actinoplanes sp. TBRC 11911]NMO53467.1 hypothetical protein [Actinoplanes sp. TBRC 11911]
MGTVTVTRDHATRLMSLVFETPEGKTIPVVLSTAEIRTVADVLESIAEPELSADALKRSVIAAIGRDPFAQA